MKIFVHDIDGEDEYYFSNGDNPEAQTVSYDWYDIPEKICMFKDLGFDVDYSMSNADWANAIRQYIEYYK